MCKYDCFNCPYPDCIAGESSTRAGYWREKYQERKQDPEYMAKCRELSKAWRARNKEKLAEQHREWMAKEGVREKVRARQKEWFEKNKERIYAAQKEKRRLEREAKQ